MHHDVVEPRLLERESDILRCFARQTWIPSLRNSRSCSRAQDGRRGVPRCVSCRSPTARGSSTPCLFLGRWTSTLRSRRSASTGVPHSCAIIAIPEEAILFVGEARAVIARRLASSFVEWRSSKRCACQLLRDVPPRAFGARGAFRLASPIGDIDDDLQRVCDPSWTVDLKGKQERGRA
jgi:hypothetical protein